MQLMNLITKLTGKKVPSTDDLKRYYQFLFPYVKRYWKAYSLLVLFLFISVYTTLGYAWFLKGLTEAAVQHDLPKLSEMILYGVSLFVLMTVVNFFNSYVRTVTVNKVKRDVKSILFDHMMHLPSRFFATYHSGDLFSRLTNDVDMAVGAIGTHIINILRLPLTAGGAFLYLFGLNAQLATVCFLFGLFALLTASVFSRYLRVTGRQIQQQLGRIGSLINESLTGNVIVRSFGLEQVFSKKFADDTDHLVSLQNKETKISGAFRAVAQVGSSAALLLCVGLGALDVARGEMSVGTLLAFISLMQHVISPFTGMARQFGGIQRALAASERVWQILDEEADVRVADASPSLVFGNSIRFEKMSFRYGDGPEVVQNIRVEVCAGQVVAFVGPSGAGKSTLFNLALGFYQPTKGRIYLGEVPYEQLAPAQLRRHLAYVPQETHLFSGTIRENLLYGRPDASEMDVIRASKDANAHDFITALPHGYDTQVGERGVILSGGQKQRISIARALLKDAPILLLDEATSALDSESEDLVKEALARLMKNRTTMIIAHRLSTIQNADWIVVMDKGRIVEQGTHGQLLEQSGLYMRLHNLQFKAFQSPELEQLS